MFHLEQSITAWRKQMSRARLSSGNINELEAHLREEIAALLAAGKSESAAFELAAQRLGAPAPLKKEFAKLRAANCNPRLAWAAWILFVASFFLPAYVGGYGWQCAGISATCLTWGDITASNWGTILLFLLTPANVVMAISPFLVSKLARCPLAFRLLRAANATAFALVWTYLLLLFFHSERQDLRIGCYLWATSFLIFLLSLFRRPARKVIYV